MALSFYWGREESKPTIIISEVGRMGSRGCHGVRVDLENFPKPDFLT